MESTSGTDWFTIKTFRKNLVEMIEQDRIAKGRYIKVTDALRNDRRTDNDSRFN